MPTKPLPGVKGSKVWLLVLTSLLALVLAGTYYGKWQRARQDPQKFLEEQARQEIEAVVTRVSKLLILPQDETPTVLTIENREDLDKSQEFLSLAENGDKLLLYQGAKKAILYRPKTNQVVSVAPINNETPEQGVEAEEEASPAASPSGEIAP
jgi:hypothetical protein